MDIDSLFSFYGSDKTKHGYGAVYDALFKNIRHMALNILEIGIGTLDHSAHSTMSGYVLDNYRPGGSLRAWRDYFPNAIVHGLDPQPDTQFKEARIITRLGFSTSVAHVKAALAGLAFDIIVDDGSHDMLDQIETMANLYPKLNPGGYYIIEDIWPNSKQLYEYLDTFFPDATVSYLDKRQLAIVSRRMSSPTPRPCDNTPQEDPLKPPSLSWDVVFNSTDPRQWRGAAAAEFIRIRRMDTGECVIFQADKKSLLEEFDTGTNGWCGSAAKRWGGYHLGIFNKEWITSFGDVAINTSKAQTFSGWGFGNNAGINDRTICAWNGKAIQDTPFEISVKNSELSHEEKQVLLPR